MKNITVFLSALVALLFSVAETNAQITPPYYNPANVRITGGTINGVTIGGTVPAVATFTTLTANTLFTVGSGATSNSGLIMGHFPSINDTFGIWTTGVTPSATNYNFVGSTTTAVMNASTAANLNVGGNTIVGVGSGGMTLTAGKILTIGSGSGTSAGLIAGYLGVSGYGAIWSTGVTPSTTNYAYASNGTATYVGGTTSVRLAVSGNERIITNVTNTTFAGDMIYDKTITTPGTTGAVTINKTTGRVNFAAAATSLVVTNSLATANSICHVTKATNDATMRLGACVAAAGSITIYADVAPAAETAVNFTVTN